MPEIPGLDPAIYRRRLRSELRRAREASEKSQRETATAMDWSLSKLIRIESGEVRIGTNDLKALLSYYDIPATRISDLLEVARAAREPARWSNYRSVATPEYLIYCGYESSAAVVRNFEPILMPGLLQTEEYARAVLSKQIDDPQRLDGLIDLRMERQEILVREQPPELHFLIDESVIWHIMGGKDVMRRQLSHLRELAAQPHVHLRIASFELGWYERMLIPYVLFEFAQPEDGEVLYIENPGGELIIRENTLLESDLIGPTSFLQTFWRLEQLARREDTAEILSRAISQL